jgi:hyaluronate lyase
MTRQVSTDVRPVSRHDPLRRKLLACSVLGFAGTAGALVTNAFGSGPSDETGERLFPTGSGAAATSVSADVANTGSFEALRLRQRRMLNSRTLDGGNTAYYNPAVAPYRGLLDALDAEATAYSATMNPRGSAYLWPVLDPYGGPGNMTRAFERLRLMTLQYTSIGSAHYHNATLLGRIQDGLYTLWSNSYHVSGPPGSWYTQIGAPMALLDTLCMLGAPNVGQPLFGDLLAAVNYFCPNPVGHAANKAWMARVVLLRAMLAGDLAKFNAARNILITLCSTTATTQGAPEGFLADGSFTQHWRHAYTGLYGVEMYYQCAWLVHLLAGAPDTALAPDDWAMLRGWAFSAFEPFLFRGAMSGAVRGRGVSRIWFNDHVLGSGFICAAILLSDVAPDPDRSSLRGLVKATVIADTERDFFTYDPVTGLDRLTIDTARLGQDIKTSASVTPRPEANATYVFPQMDRVAHRRPGFAYIVAMHSTRIADYESINGENRHGWYTGSGMVHFHNADLDHYDDDYWPTIDPYRLPGTTVDRRPRDVRTGNYQQGVFGDAAVVGGVGNKTCGVAACHLFRDQAGWPGALKSWLFFSNFVVCMGSGVTSTGSYPVETIIENRNLGQAGGNVVLMNASANAVMTDREVEETLIANWLTIQGVGGYVFLGSNPPIKGLRTLRQGAWRDINTMTTSPTDIRQREYATLWFDHGMQPNDQGYSYVFFPNAGATTVSAFAQAPNVSLIRTNAVHYARAIFTGLTAYNAMFWSAGSAGILTASARLAVSIRRETTQVLIALSEPSQLLTGAITLDVAIPYSSVAAGGDPEISVSPISGGARLTFSPAGTAGMTKKVVLNL